MVQPTSNTAHRIELSQATRAWLLSGGKFPETLHVSMGQSGNTDLEVLDRDADGRVALVGQRMGHKGFVLKVRDRNTMRVYAAKLCLREDYSPGKLLEEQLILADLDVDAPLVTYDRVGTVAALPDEPSGSQWLCFIGRWIEGETLDQWLTRAPDDLQPDLALQVLRKLLQVVLYLDAKALKHDDLHLGNVMLAPVSAAVRQSDPRGDPLALHVIDFGSIKRRNTPTKKPHDDWSRYVACVVRLHNVLHRNRKRALAARYPHFLDKLFEFAQRLSEEDPSRQFLDTSEYFQALDEAALSLSASPDDDGAANLSSPFTAISAEHLASDKMLLDLFVKGMDWFDEVRDANPIVLTGPRGCGKSMVFRYLALRTHLADETTIRKTLAELNFVGIYIGCASDLQNDLLWIQREESLAESLAPQILTFFNLIAARELFRTISLASKVDAAASALGISSIGINDLIRYATEQLGLPNEHVAISGLDPAQAIADDLDRQRIRLARSMLLKEPPGVQLPATFIRDLSREASRRFSGLRNRPLVFLLDDYTQQRLGSGVQNILNQVLWNRDHSCAFKISCEPFGFDSRHFDGAKIDENREYQLINTGYRMQLGAPEEVRRRREFVQGLLDKRLDAAGFAGSSAGLIGQSEYAMDTDLAIAIREGGQGRKPYYYGLEVLANAWSGDVATVLFMVREMFRRGGVNASTVERISPMQQHEAVVHVSTALVARVAHCHPYGSEMRQILEIYGGLARRLLEDGALQKDERSAKKVPQRRYRMEIPIADDGSFLDQLDHGRPDRHLSSIYKELIRRSIFIELDESRSKHNERTHRIQLRSSLLPKFGTSLGRKNYMPIHNLSEFVMLLQRDQLFEKRIWDRTGGSSSEPYEDLFTQPDAHS